MVAVLETLPDELESSDRTFFCNVALKTYFYSCYNSITMTYPFTVCLPAFRYSLIA
jgi:hypothetical protein